MEPFQANVHHVAKDNETFRTVLFTGEHSQLVVMSLHPGEEIGDEVHDEDQLFYFVVGRGQAVLDGRATALEEHDVLCVPAGTRHNILNTGREPMKLFTIYAPAHHPVGTIHRTRIDALAAERNEAIAH
jgi:mannose-6-phosphate isomerase-like protein (cupin superfamily)